MYIFRDVRGFDELVIMETDKEVVLSIQWVYSIENYKAVASSPSRRTDNYDESVIINMKYYYSILQTIKGIITFLHINFEN